VVLATWNLENLFLPGEGDGPRDQPAYERKLDALAGTIGELDPDVLAVQEVGDPRALDDLVERLGGSWNVALAGVREGERSIRVGFVSKPALDSVEEVLAFPDGLEPIQVEDGGVPQREMGRPALKARIRIENRTVDLVTCHLKSKLLTYPDGRFQPRDEDERARYAGYALFRRTAEAVTLRAYVNRLLEGAGDERAVALLGDLNDEPLAATTQIFHGPPGSEIGTPGFEQPDKGDPWRLWNLAWRIPAERRHSRRFRGRDELIDHILVSHALVHDVESVDTGPGEPPSITETPSARRDEPGSDHLPVVARFAPPA
jgi:endonuclease/exonuclease/phosphatase family metal-dependent hydrolase